MAKGGMVGIGEGDHYRLGVLRSSTCKADDWPSPGTVERALLNRSDLSGPQHPSLGVRSTRLHCQNARPCRRLLDYSTLLGVGWFSCFERVCHSAKRVPALAVA